MTILQGAERISNDEPQAVDLSALTNAELRAICEERGIEVPRRATKAQLLGLLGEVTP